MRIFSRRSVIASMGAIGASAALAGCAPTAQTVGTSAAQTADAVSSTAWAPTAINAETPPLIAESASVIYTDEEVEAILNNEAVVTEDFVYSDGTAIAPVYQMLRNRMNRCGWGFGSMVASDHQLDLFPTLFSEEEAQACIEMPLYKMFSAAEFAKASGRTKEECLATCNALADRGLLRRFYENDEPVFNIQASEYGYYEAYNQHFDKTYLDLKELNQGPDAAFSFIDSGTTMYRTVPVDLDVVIDGNYTEYDDWRAIFKRNDTFAVSPCMCRSNRLIRGEKAANVQEILKNDVRFDCGHPVETCITTGKQAAYFIETGAGREITADEAVAILEDAISKGMIVETVYTKSAESVCCCHADCCLNVGAVRKLNGGPAMKYYSNFSLQHQKENCIKCGTCERQCPMFAITMDEEGYPIVDNACVRCGQCATVCPQGARGLLLNDEADRAYLPEDVLEDYAIKARNRISKGYLFDLTSQAAMNEIVAAAAAKAKG